MGHAIPAQHPPVVLRSHFNKLRALLALTLVCVAGLIVAIVSLAGDDDEVAGKPVQAINHAGEKYVNPSTGYPAGTLTPQGPRTGYSVPVERADSGPFGPPSGIVSSAEHRPQVSRPGYDGGPVERYRAETKYFIGPVGR
jgi:hypothetical protein